MTAIRSLLNVSLALFTALGGCSGPTECGAAGVFPLSITVVDAVTRTKLCDATVTIDSANYHQQLESCPYQGGTGAGTYAVTATHMGYGPATQSNVIVQPVPQGDSCGQPHTSVTVELTPGST
jgi:hypothetical protein